ncbi:phosphopentomutase/phosphoglucosamine mutase [Haloarcula sp. S1CR25-12]|uniref:Phosphopentomutase/phosphoglucosamine mutase n=1 Tax=Haloarcula saliterrae TaxID=2950534 RepID=A0ABU2F862_9EURY|nr:phosphopentomutase/phosphoglucosamine mutase [Haloarcula sp. S1CR25-12]MDS0258447.1 phosphopentomutase/phosphoglucosamine mutase [Haloarcula sp. S1CR25-12]
MKLFGTAGIRGRVDERVTPELALRVGRAAGQDGNEFVVGHDGRVTSPALADGLASGLVSAGVDVVRVGQVPTPALAYASRGRRGVMVTASHNPPTDNGLKLFVDGREYGDEAEGRITERVEAGVDTAAWDRWGDSKPETVLPLYRDAVADYARQHGGGPERLTVAVDCGNGMAGVATPQVLRELGAEVVATEANVDGHFPARGSKPTPDTLAQFRSFVAEAGVDLGFAHDGDADRIVVVDDEGGIVHEDTVVAMLAEHYTRASDAADPVVVTTPNASGRIDERVRAAGGRVERVRLGALHEGIARERREAGSDDEVTEVVFAAEPWKHVHPAFGGWIDGVASAAVLTRLLAAEGLGRRRAAITERPYRKVSVDCPDSHKPAVMAALESALPDAFPEGDVATEHGVRLAFSDGSWALVRPSGTEPYVRLYAESDDVDALAERVREVVESAVEDAR